MRVVCIGRRRPNYMKVKPVMDALEEGAAHLVHTGQHYDPAMNDVFFADLGIRPPDHRLQVGSGRHAAQTGRVMAAFEPLVEQVRPDIVVELVSQFMKEFALGLCRCVISHFSLLTATSEGARRGLVHARGRG